jgi:hypothetical protein
LLSRRAGTGAFVIPGGKKRKPLEEGGPTFTLSAMGLPFGRLRLGLRMALEGGGARDGKREGRSPETQEGERPPLSFPAGDGDSHRQSREPIFPSGDTRSAQAEDDKRG